MLGVGVLHKSEASPGLTLTVPGARAGEGLPGIRQGVGKHGHAEGVCSCPAHAYSLLWSLLL